MIQICENGMIRVVRGDTGAFTITPKYENGEIYKLGDGERIRFLVYASPKKPLIEKESDTQSEDGSVRFDFSAADTDIPETVYKYRAKMIRSDGTEIDRVDTFIGADAGRFEVI